MRCYDAKENNCMEGGEQRRINRQKRFNLSKPTVSSQPWQPRMHGSF